MKKIILLYALVIGVQASYAQTFDEWFRQRKTQLKYLVSQISALTTYTKYLQKGYEIAKDGTSVISNIKHGDFNLHDGYFTSLKLVSSNVRANPLISAIIADQGSIVKIFRELIAFTNERNQLTATEATYLGSVYDNLNKDSEKNLEELYLVITSDELQMKEDERIKRIILISKKMKEKLSFAQTFTNGVIVLIRQRVMERQETDRQKKIFGLN